MLINNAGYAARGAVADFDPDALDRMLRVNVLALSRLSRSAMGRMMAEGRGSIINVASATMFMQFPGNAGYGSSKNYVAAFTRHMQLEAQGSGVRVQLLVPGLVATDFHRVAGADLAEFPSDRVMKVDDLVVASLRALEMEEEVCIPSLPEIGSWDRYVAAERVVAANVSRDRIGARYH
jgi:short-subunit dehydrogenase